jgi:hypothetical protein
VPGLSEISGLLAKKKKLVRAMAWAVKPNRKDGGWYEFISAVADSNTGVVFEGVSVNAQWRPAVGDRSAVFYVGLVMDNARVYAIDVAPLDRHKNMIGAGRPYYKQEITGAHEHTWSAEGGGYAEPVTAIDASNQHDVWSLFLKNANIEQNGSFVHPDSAVSSGQGRLLL